MADEGTPEEGMMMMDSKRKVCMENGGVQSWMKEECLIRGR